jgi:hypothetical protein
MAVRLMMACILPMLLSGLGPAQADQGPNEAFSPGTVQVSDIAALNVTPLTAEEIGLAAEWIYETTHGCGMLERHEETEFGTVLYVTDGCVDPAAASSGWTHPASEASGVGCAGSIFGLVVSVAGLFTLPFGGAAWFVSSVSAGFAYFGMFSDCTGLLAVRTNSARAHHRSTDDAPPTYEAGCGRTQQAKHEFTATCPDVV